jgi:hypothetical protein
MTETTVVAWTIVVRIEDTDRWIDWSTGHRTVPDVLAAAELIVPISTIAEIRFDRITTVRKRFSLADLGATDAVAPSAPADRAAVLREAANGLAALGPLDSLVSAPAAWTEAIETLRRMADQIAEDERRRMADEAQQPETQAEIECANCWREVENRSTPNMGGPSHDKWVHVPGGFTVCFPQRGADSPRAEPKPAAVSQPAVARQADTAGEQQ